MFGDLVFTAVLLTPSEKLLEEIASNPDAKIAYLDAGRLSEGVVLRHARAGDRFIPLGMAGMKKLSDYFIDEKLTPEDKRAAVVLECRGGIAWLAGRRIDERFKITAGTKSILRIEMTRRR